MAIQDLPRPPSLQQYNTAAIFAVPCRVGFVVANSVEALSRPVHVQVTLVTISFVCFPSFFSKLI